MNESNPSPSPESRPHHQLSLESLGLETDNAQLRALWRDALMQSGERFAAYAQLRSPSLHTLDVLADFDRRFIAHYETMAEAISVPLGAAERELRDIEEAHGLQRGSVTWDYDTLERSLRSSYDVVDRESGVYLFTKEPEPTEQELITGLAATTDDPEVLARWDEGVGRWGDAFLAFATLRLPSLHTTDVLTAFEVCYVASFDNLEEMADAQIDANGWKQPLAAFRARRGIGPEFLVWDHQAIYRQLEFIYEFVWFKGKVHAFAK